MSSLVSNPSHKSLPSFPLEIQHEMLRQCDPSTLARTSRVSLAFLELSAPLLYEDVTIRKLKQLNHLFSRRRPNQHPHLSPHLSLNQIKTLRIVFIRPLDYNSYDPVYDSVPKLSSVEKFLDLSSSRINGSRTLPIAEFLITTDYLNRDLLLELYTTLLPRLNPLRSSWRILGGDKPDTFGLLDIDNSGLAGWTRLETLDLYGKIPRSWNGPPKSNLPVGLPLLLPPRRRVVRIHFSSLRDVPVSRLVAILRELNYSLASFGPEPTSDGSLVFVVGSEKERVEAEAAIREDSRWEGWRRVWGVEVGVDAQPDV